MPRIADYTVLIDNSFSLSLAGSITRNFDFTLPADTQLDNAVLFFMVETGPANVQFSVAVNGAVQAVLTYNDRELHSAHEVVDGLLPVGINTVTFTVLAGGGTAEIGDVVLFFQRDIP